MENTPTPIDQAAKEAAMKAKIKDIDRRLDMLEDPETLEYAMLMRNEAEEWGLESLTAAQTINVALFHRHFQETVEAGLEALKCPDMYAAFIDYVEGRARASVAESRSPAIILAFRTRKPRS
jgi:hypothetical protein